MVEVVSLLSKIATNLKDLANINRYESFGLYTTACLIASTVVIEADYIAWKD